MKLLSAINTLPYDKISNWSKLKAFQDDKMILTKKNWNLGWEE